MVRDMEIPFQNNKVYVAVSEDLHDGFLTLDWALRKWSTQSIIIVILYAATNICKDYVYTPLGKFPASSVSEEKLKDLEQNEEAKTQRILSKYKAFCDKVKTEILRIEKYNESVQKIMVDLISGIGITKLVMSLKFMRPVCWKSRGSISGSFYVHRQKPGFCELFIICGGKLVFLREDNNEGLIEDEKGVMLARIREKRPTFKSYVEKMFSEASAKGKKPCYSPSPPSSTSDDQWEKYKEEIELYFSELEVSHSEAADQLFQKLAKKPDMADNNMTREEKRGKIQEIQEVIQQTRKEFKANPARLARAEWAISLCSSRAVELGGCINEEIAKRAQLEKEFCSTKEELNKLEIETEEKRAMFNSTLQLQDQLSSKLHLLSQAISQAELQVEEETRAQAAVVQEAEKLRRQRDIFLRRIEFSKQGSGEQSFDYRQFSAAEIRAATDDLSERLRLKSSGDWTNVYKGCLNPTLVAVKIYNNSGNADSEEAFQAKVKLLSSIRHPNMLNMMGFCSELNCIVFEYMPNGCLRDILFSTHRSSKRRNRCLNWVTRIRIAAEVSTGLSFLHEAKPRPMVHGRLNPSRILLDRHNVAKFGGLVPSMCYDVSEISSDVRAFGNLIFQLLSGRNWGEEAIMMDQSAVINVLDEKAGDWPLDLAVELAGIAVKCLSNQGKDVRMAMVARDMDKVKKKADELVRSAEFAVGNEADDSEIVEEDAEEIPSVFLCPIFQDIMQDPHIAADGFSYELEAMGEWLRTGHDTSPMTNLKLKHSLLTPNHILRSLIHDWQNKSSHLPSQGQCSETI